MSPFENSREFTLESIEREINARRRLGSAWPFLQSGFKLNSSWRDVGTAELLYAHELIYGNNDIQNISEVMTHEIGLLANAKRICGIVHKKKLPFDGIDTYTLRYRQLSRIRFPLKPKGPKFDLCTTGELKNYLLEPSASFCSGFLIGPSRIATAAHCILDEKREIRKDIDQLKFIFSFESKGMPSGFQTEFHQDHVYHFDKLVDWGYVMPPSRSIDWAVIDLDRPVKAADGQTNLSPVTRRSSGQISDNQDLYVIGHPLGLPKKAAKNAEVRENGASDYFAANLDTFAGNSGSPVFNANNHQVEGILIRGDKDFIMTQHGCITANSVGNRAGRGEDCQRILHLNNY